MKDKLKLLVYAATAVPKPSEWIKQVNPEGIGPSNSFVNMGIIYIKDYFVPFTISLLLFIVILLSLIYLIWGGISWIMSGGEKEGLTKAKNTVTHALIGLALALGSFIVVNLVFSFFGVSLFGVGSVNCGPGQEC